MADDVLKPGYIPVQISYASPEETWVMDLQVPQGESVVQALDQAGLLERFAEAVEKGFIGIYSRKVPGDRVLLPYDRIEIYRPLVGLPQDIRRRRVERLRGKKAGKR